MIVKQPSAIPFNYQRLLPRLMLIVVGLLLLAGIYYVFNENTSQQLLIDTSYEKTKGTSFYGAGHLFSGSEFQTKTLAKTGEYAILVLSDSSQHTSFIEIGHPKNLYAHVSVWAKVGKGNPKPIIHINAKKEKIFSRSFSEFDKKDDWSKMEFSFLPPNNVDTIVLNLEVEGKGEIYFDDLAIKFTKIAPVSNSPAFQPEKLNLRIDPVEFDKISKKRNEALERGILISSDDDWINVKLEEGENELDAKARLKGDWTDHLSGDKWSYRVKFKKDHTWKRLKTVSFQTPKARNLLYEWVLHQLWEREDILTTRYDFVSMDFNGVPKGIYAYEEHFEKQLLEYKSRREGPIVKFQEAAMWNAWQKAMKKYNSLPSSIAGEYAQFKDAEITAFGESKTLKSPVLAKHFDEANNLLYQYQSKLKPASEIFDIDQLAKYYAICDLMDAHHAIIWHNQRFYYNPATNKLEPIGYDGNVGLIWYEGSFLGQKHFGYPEDTKDDIGVFENLSADTSFVNRYIYFLDKFTQQDYVYAFVKEVKAGALARQEFLKTEFPTATFDPNQIVNRAKKIQLALYPANEHAIIANEQGRGVTTKKIVFKNKHGIPLKVLGTGVYAENMNFALDEPIVAWNNHGKKIHRYETLDIPLEAKYIFFQPIGMDTIMHSTIHKYSTPRNTTASQEIFSNVELDTTGIYSIRNKYIIFQEGIQTISKDIIIPKGYKVIFEQGCQLDFIKGAAFMSQSPVEMNGTDGSPVVITSSDKSARGFTVMQAGGKSILNYAVFSNLDTWKYKNWQLTGAVTFYESDVKIEKTIIRSNSCEDALNIIRSEFDIREMTIAETFGDGFDADFCKGKISHSQFLNTGNDGMDFSGSIIAIDDCIVDGSGDKGLSAGEESTITVKKLVIKNAVLGLAAKDLSYVYVKTIDLENCQQGFAAFRKKPEYGGAKIDVIDYTTKEVTILYQVEKGSRIKLKDKLIKE
ncbi:MAG: hypothetical protein ACI94Y_002076 [Maribacter sp.]|jgi:hypothetical protein